MFQRKKNATTFHITDLENLYGNVRDGNNHSALRFAVRILDRGLNGPPEGIDTKRTVLEHTFGPAEQAKARELCDKLEELVGGRQLGVDRSLLREQNGLNDTEEETATRKQEQEATKGKVQQSAERATQPQQQTGKTTKKGEQPQQPAATQTPGGFKTVDPPAEFSKSPHATDSPDVQGSVPSTPRFTSTEPGARSVNWDTLAQIIALVIQMVRDWQNTN